MGRIKMTEEDWAEARAMRANGFTLQEVADRFGVTRQLISKKMPTYCHAKQTCRDPGKIIYPGLRRYMMDNRFTFSRFAVHCGVGYPQLYNALTGRADPFKATIDKILAGTGMTYEEAFGKEAHNGKTPENNPV